MGRETPPAGRLPISVLFLEGRTKPRREFPDSPPVYVPHDSAGATTYTKKPMLSIRATPRRLPPRVELPKQSQEALRSSFYFQRPQTPLQAPPMSLPKPGLAAPLPLQQSPVPRRTSTPRTLSPHEGTAISPKPPPSISPGPNPVHIIINRNNGTQEWGCEKYLEAGGFAMGGVTLLLLLA